MREAQRPLPLLGAPPVSSATMAVHCSQSGPHQWAEALPAAQPYTTTPGKSHGGNPQDAVPAEEAEYSRKDDGPRLPYRPQGRGLPPSVQTLGPAAQPMEAADGGKAPQKAPTDPAQVPGHGSTQPRGLSTRTSGPPSTRSPEVDGPAQQQEAAGPSAALEAKPGISAGQAARS